MLQTTTKNLPISLIHTVSESACVCVCACVNEKRKLKVQQDWQRQARPRSPASTMTAAAAAAAASTSTPSPKKYATLFATAAFASVAAVALPASASAPVRCLLFSLSLLLLLPLPLPLRELQAEIKCDLFAWLWTARENNEKVAAYQWKAGKGKGRTLGRTYAHICQVLLRHSICSCNNSQFLSPYSPFCFPCLAHCWLCLRVVMRSKLYLPSIVHDVNRSRTHTHTPHTGCNANWPLGVARFDFFIGFDECVAEKTRF